MDDDTRLPVPWSARAPQRYVFAVIAVILGIAIAVTAAGFIAAGKGGIVPFLMITAGPGVAIFYVYYYGFRRFDDADRAES